MKEIHMSPKKQPFEAPKGYFDEFPNRLQQRIKQEKNNNEARKPINKWLYLTSGVAASIIIALFWTLQIQNYNFNAEQDALEIALFNEVLDDEILEYLTNSNHFLYDISLEEDIDLEEFIIDEYEELYYQ